jgi:hypothetical protein
LIGARLALFILPEVLSGDVCPNPPPFDKIQGLLPSVDSRKQGPSVFSN